MSASRPLGLNYLKLRARSTRKSLVLALLGELADAAGYLTEPISKGYHFAAGTPAFRAFHALRNQKLILARQIGKRLEITLTARGIVQAEMERMRQVKKKLPHGCVLIIMFDFPESERTRRNLWRRYLKWFGFIQVQKSVWQIKYDVSAEFARFIKRIGAEEWIKIFIAQEIA